MDYTTYEQLNTNKNENLETTDDSKFYVKDRIIPDSIEIHLYSCNTELNRVDKTEYLVDKGLVYGIFRDDVVITSFDIVIEYASPVDFNYLYIPLFNRYYFVDNYTINNKKLVTLSLSVDVLMTYKDYILTLTGFVDRNENGSGLPIVDNMNAVVQGYNLDSVEVENGVINVEDGDYVVTGFDLQVVQR